MLTSKEIESAKSETSSKQRAMLRIVQLPDEEQSIRWRKSETTEPKSLKKKKKNNRYDYK